MKIFFTGGQGFIGQHTSRRLSQLGHEVTLYQGDILDSESLFQALGAQSYDFVIHLAGISSVPQAESDLEKLFAVNQFGTGLLLEGIKAQCPSAHLIFSSSAQVYNSADLKSPLTEQAQVSPMNAYARSKYSCEVLIRSYSEIYQLATSVFRIFNHTHKSHHPEFFLPSIYEKCLLALKQGQKAQEITVGNLDLIRDISPVQRIIEIFEKYIDSKHSPGSHKLFNICSGQGVNLKVLAHELGHAMGVDLRFSTDPAKIRRNDPAFFVGDNQKLKSFLNIDWPQKLDEKRLVQKFLEDLN